MIGQDRRGNWVVRDQSGLRGGIFVKRAEALRYVHLESGDHPGVIVMVSGELELDTNAMRGGSPILNQINVEEQRARRIA
jgi:hypothetical protein